MQKTDEAIVQLQQAGYTVVKKPPIVDKVFKVEAERFSGEWLRFGVVSDTHIGSKFQQMTHLCTFYKACAQMGVSMVLHCGDMVDGGSVYRGQEYETFLHGADAQRDYVVRNYPKQEGVKTYAIAGNHCESFWKTAGVDVIAEIAERREDIVYLGMYGAYMQIANLKVYLHHGSGGVAYSRSYKIQRLTQELAPEAKPNLLFAGHWHTPCILPGYRNVEAVQMSAFQAQTPYLKQKGVYPFVAGLIVEVLPDRRGIASVKYQWLSFYKMRKEDW